MAAVSRFCWAMAQAALILLPTGLTLSSAGFLSGRPTTAGTFNFTITATDVNNCKGSQSYSIVIVTCPAVTISPATLAAGSVGAAYSQTLTASGGASPYNFV